MFPRLDDLHKKDLAKAENERAKNNLESFLYEFRDKLDSETIEELSSEDEREKIRTKFSEISDWIDEEGFDSTADVSFAFSVIVWYIHTCTAFSYEKEAGFIRPWNKKLV